MHKIVLLQNNEITKRVFSEKDLKQLKALGEAVANTEAKDPGGSRAKELMRDADIVITSWGCPRLDGDILKAAPRLKLVLHAAGSVKGIVSPELREKRIRVSSSAEPLGKGVAETALGLTVISLKHIWQLSENTRQGEWNKDKDKVRELFGITVGVIGAGRVGRNYIRLLKNFDVDILLYDPTVTEEKAKILGVEKTGLETLMERSDVVSIHAPSIPETDKMINQERLARMKDHAVLINTARGSVVDEAALVKELAKGRLFACLDVTEPEPPASDHAFRSLPNVILTPHIAGAVNNGMLRIGKYVVEELQRYLEGRPMDGEVDLSRLDILA